MSLVRISTDELMSICAPVEPGLPYFRPYVLRTDQNPCDFDVWIVGSNPATPIGEKHGVSLRQYAASLNDWKVFSHLYERVRTEQGKTLVSKTRKYMDEFEQWLMDERSCRIVETNTCAYPTKSSKDLSPSRLSPSIRSQGNQVFESLLFRFKPRFLIVHGNRSHEQLKRLLKKHGMTTQWAQCRPPGDVRFRFKLFHYPDRRLGVILEVPHFNRSHHDVREFEELKRQLWWLTSRQPTDRWSWSVRLDMPERREALPVRFELTEEQLERIRYGWYPTDMGEKWFVYYDRERLYFHRSWTGICAYEIGFQRIGDDYITTEVLVNRDLSQYEYMNTTVHDEIQSLVYVLDGLFSISLPIGE